PSLFVDNSDEESDDDDNAYVEIPLVTPIRSATIIPSLGNQGEGFVALAAEDSLGKGIMTDATVASSAGVSLPWPSTRPAPSLRKVELPGIDPAVCKTVVGQFPTPRKMVRIEALTNDLLNANMSVLHCLMMSRDGELLARYHGFLQSHHEYVQSIDSRWKGFQKKFVLYRVSSLWVTKTARLSTSLNQATILKDEEILRLKASPPKFVSFFWGQFQVASARFERGLSLHRTKEEFAAVLKEISHFVPSTQDRLAEASSLIAQTDYAFINKISEHAAEPLSVILQLEPKKFTRPANVLASRDTRVSPPIAKESTVTLVSSSLRLLSNIVPSSSVAPLESNKEWVNAMVDGPDNEMEGGAGNGKSWDVFMKGAS
ncbi:hypothetical protein Tco_1537415, partial [Tanacetum coccineum]